MDVLDRISAIFNRGLAFAAGLFLIAMMLVTVGEMVLRMFGRPMAGTIEVIAWLAAVTTAFALGYTQMYQGNVAIDLFFNRFSPRTRAVINMLVSLASAALFTIITWHVFQHAGVLKQTGSLSETMKVIVYPWVYLVSLGCAGLTFVLFVDLMKSCRHVFKSGGGKGRRAVSDKQKGDR